MNAKQAQGITGKDSVGMVVHSVAATNVVKSV